MIHACGCRGVGGRRPWSPGGVAVGGGAGRGCGARLGMVELNDSIGHVVSDEGPRAKVRKDGPCDGPHRARMPYN